MSNQAKNTILSHLLVPKLAQKVDYCDYCDYCQDYSDYSFEYSDYCFWIILIFVIALFRANSKFASIQVNPEIKSAFFAQNSLGKMI